MRLQISKELNEIITYSKEEAMRLGSYEITSDHLMLGIIRHEDNIASKILNRIGLDSNLLKKEIEEHIRKKSIIYDSSDSIILAKESENILKLMFLEAHSMNLEKPNALHLLLAIIKNGEGYSSKIIQEKGLEYKALKKVVTSNNLSSNEEDNYIEPDNSNNDSLFKKESTNRGSKQDSKSVLNQFGYNVSKAAEEDKLDPVVGRDKEIERLAQILGRRKKNNPVLIGEPGVGKSAIVEGLAIKIAKREVSRALMNKRIISLDIGSIVAGTKYRGQFEERIKSILKEVSEDKNVILFIDEMHTLIGAGGAAGSLDAANMLKPALARGEIQCIGATTLDEYRQIIEKDGALDRRFQKVIVEPTDFAQTLEILEHIKGRYEIHHNVRYTNEALRACISMSQRYISDRCLPDKAIDIMDEAGSRVHLKNLNVPRKVAKLEKAIEQIKKELSDAVSNADYKNAAIFRDVRDYKIKELEKAKSEWIAEQSKNPIIVGKEDIALVLSMATHIPVTKIAEAEGNKLINMGESLKKKIIGQDEAVEIVTKAIQRNRAGLKDPSKPIGTFLFLGPTGVGKTQLAKVLAEYLFDSPESLIRIDMSEYMEKYAVSRLIGAPPGYVGYNEGGQLSEKVRRHPYSVVLLDEIEKAHPDIFNILLQVLDEGRLTDSNGRNIDFRNTVVILTSNIGSKELKAFGAGMGYSNSVKRNYDATERQIIEKAVGKTFTPEFINRLDEQVIFNSLEKKDIEKIIDIELSALYERVEQAGYKLSITAGAKKFVAKEGFDPLYGARPLKRSIQQYIEDPIAEAIISGKYKNGETITISINGGKNIILK